MDTNPQLEKWCNDIVNETGDWSKLTPDERTNALNTCTCILSAQTFANALGCATASMNACITGTIDSDCQLINGQPNPKCPCTGVLGPDGKPQIVDPSVAQQRLNYLAGYAQYNDDKGRYKTASDLYNAIQHASWGANQSDGDASILRTYTNMNGAKLQRFCGGVNRTGPNGFTKYTPSAGIQSGPVNEAIDIPWYFTGPGDNVWPGNSPCNTALDPNTTGGFYLVDAEVFTNGGLSKLEDLGNWWLTKGFNKVPVLYDDYIIVKWTGEPGLKCTSCGAGGKGMLTEDQADSGNEPSPNAPCGTAGDVQCAICSQTCTVNAQIVFTKSLEAMCSNPLWTGDAGAPKWPDDYISRWPAADPTNGWSAENCSTEYAPKPAKFECCVNAVNIGKDVKGNISIHQKCDLKNDLDPTKENCASFPGLPGCSSPGPDPGPGGGDCSDTDPCVTGACVNGKCRCGPDRIGKRCENCNVSSFNCNVVPGAILNEKTCKCECGPGYWGVGDELCFKSETPWYDKIRDWFRWLWISLMKDTKRNKILLLVGVGLLIISLVILSIMIPGMI